MEYVPVLAALVSGLFGKKKRPTVVDNPALIAKVKQLEEDNSNIKKKLSESESNTEELKNEMEKNNATIADLLAKNQRMNEELNELDTRMKVLQNIARRDEDKYNSVRAFIANMAPLVFLESTALVGPKGSGKSTFLWLLGLGPKPTASFSDGTTSTMNMDKFVDTIGINIELRQVLKMLAIFLVKGVPSTLVVFSNDRVVRDALVLSYLGLRNLMFVMMSPEAVYDEEDPSRFYRQRRMDELRLHDPSIICLTHHEGNIPRNNNLGEAMFQLFPLRTAQLPEWDVFLEDEEQKILNTIRYEVCSLAKKFVEECRGNELVFLNDLV